MDEVPKRRLCQLTSAMLDCLCWHDSLVMQASVCLCIVWFGAIQFGAV